MPAYVKLGGCPMVDESVLVNMTPRDVDRYEHILKDLKRLDLEELKALGKKRILKQFDLIYSTWFSKAVNLVELKKDFANQIDAALNPPPDRGGLWSLD